MNQQTLLRFIQQIISSDSPRGQSVFALQELKSILEKQNVAPDDLELIQTAIDGVKNSNGTMVKEIPSNQPMTAQDLKNAAVRAHEQRLRELEEMRNGRC